MSELKRFDVFTGKYIITSVPALLTTILGSCISVCLWDRELRMAGMNHYLLPGTPGDMAGHMNRGVTSVRLLIEGMLNRKAQLKNLEAKVFGGCNSLSPNFDVFRTGEQNAVVAFQMLKEYGIRVTASNVGGAHGRKIVFNSVTGKVRMRLLGESGELINKRIGNGFDY
jgi:chemotaxis protein CheD